MNEANLADRSNEASPDQITALVREILGDDQVHARWLNTLSLLENSGARKISAAQHPELVTEEMLRHTVEESRHAWYLKRQIRKLGEVECPSYEPQYLLAPTSSRHYLQKLDMAVSRLVKSHLGLKGSALRSACYLLVTYGIEVKADLLYGTYERLLEEHESRVTVRSIIADEENHLDEMTTAIEREFEDPAWWIGEVCAAEQQIFAAWLTAVTVDVQSWNS